jgi:SAM-dependent methyltransferase
MMGAEALATDAALAFQQKRSSVLADLKGHADPRWPQIVGALAALRADGRRALRIVDADCGAGIVLIDAVAHALSLGFTAIEGRGIDGSPAMIGRARSALQKRRHPAVGLSFEARDAIDALREETDFPADIVIWKRAGSDRHATRMTEALKRAGRVVICDPSTGRSV